MRRSLYLFYMLLFLGIFAVHFTVYMAHADDATTVKGSKSNSDNLQVQPNPEPVDATTIKTTKSNTFRQVQPVPEPVEATTVKSSKSNSQDIQPNTKPVEVNPCASTRCQSGYHCVPLSQVGFCAKDQAENVTITCYGISSTMHGACADYAHQLVIHPKCICTNL